jgi:hypothetical protein
MKKEDKTALISELQNQLGAYSHFYLTNIEGLNAEKTSALRRACFKADIKLVMAKNTLLKKALEAKGIDAAIFDALKGNTALMLCNTGNAPAKLIKEIVKKERTLMPNRNSKPLLWKRPFTLVLKTSTSSQPSSPRTNSLQTLLLCCNRLLRTSFLLSNPEVPPSTEFSRLWVNAPSNRQTVRIKAAYEQLSI